jgi:two-component system cell cycle sensor histidine kinase/response regulator CckA
MVNDRARPTGWRRWVSGPRGTALSAALVAGILFGVAWLELGRWRENQRLQVLRGQVEVALGGRSSALASALGRRLALLDGLHAFVELEAGSDRLARVFPDFASRLRGAVPGIRNLAVARGTVYVLVSPLAGNEKIIGYNLLADPRAEVREDTRRALDGPGPSLSRPIELVQGGLGVIARRAVRQNGVVWGLVAIVLDIDPILKESGLVPTRGDVLIAVRAHGGSAFFGPPETFAGDPVIQQINLPDGSWDIAAQPRRSWRAPLMEERRLWLASGLVLVFIPMALVFALTWRQSVRRQYQADTERLIEERTAALARTTVIVENSPVVLVRWLPGDGWPVEYVSDNIAQFGYSPAEFQSGRLKWSDILIPADRERMRQEVARDRDVGLRRTRQEYRIATADGRVRWMEDRTSIVEGRGGRLIHQGIIIDVTERKQREEAEREAERQLRDILESVQLIAVMMDTTGRITFCNSYLLGLTGWGREEIIGGDWFELFVPVSARADVRRWVQESLDKGAFDGSHENPIVTRDGVAREMFWDNTLIRDVSGTVIGLASFGRDVTEQRQLEAQYRQSQKMEAVGQLAGGIAHDFNNLLQVIGGYASMALDAVPAGSPLGMEVTEIQRAADRATSLVRQLLAFSRRQTMERRVIDANDTVGNLLKMLRRVIGEHIELEFHPGHDVATVHADPGQIEQVLVNLCVNARDAMPEGGRITMSTSRVVIDSAFCEQRPWARQGEFVLLTVSDTGPGIPPDIVEHIFEPFFTTKDVGKGTGLGLATVYGIVKQHDGMIEVSTGPERGATFLIYLLAAPSDVKPEEPQVSAPAARDGHETILLAEDEDLVRNFALRVLEHGGYRVLVAKDGAEAIALVESRGHEIDLALLDVMMPKVNGPQVHARIRQTHPGMAVLYCSAYSRQALTDSAVPDEESLELLLKPYAPRVLLERVRAVLAARARAGGASSAGPTS